MHKSVSQDLARGFCTSPLETFFAKIWSMDFAQVLSKGSCRALAEASCTSPLERALTDLARGSWTKSLTRSHLGLLHRDLVQVLLREVLVRSSTTQETL